MPNPRVSRQALFVLLKNCPTMAVTECVLADNSVCLYATLLFGTVEVRFRSAFHSFQGVGDGETVSHSD